MKTGMFGEPRLDDVGQAAEARLSVRSIDLARKRDWRQQRSHDQAPLGDEDLAAPQQLRVGNVPVVGQPLVVDVSTRSMGIAGSYPEP